MILIKSVSNAFSNKKLAKTFPALSVSLAAVMAMSVNGVAQAQEYKKITRLGTSQSVCEGGVETAAELQTFFANNPEKVRSILTDSGWSGDADALLAAVANGEMTEKAFPVGTKLAWMGSKKNGKYVALPYREWAGKQSFSGFELKLNDSCRVYELAIPKACCNVSLISVSEDTTSPECAPKPVAVAPVEVAPAIAEEPVAKVDPLALVPFFGAFVGTETRPRFETAWQMDMRDSSGLVGLKAGLLKPLSEKTSLSGVLSYYDRNGINGGNEYPENNFAIDFGVERKLSERAFIGGGIGAWNVDDSDFRDASVYGLVGGDIGKSKLQWFLEGRVFDSDSQNHDSLSDNKMVSAGIRYLIK
ncbi:hypothetical protein NBRC116583_20750 [Arenicella sp. 4NH20-0111]|uniref:hypothetical protein n=1 Tax=Arenicella sp. 4NH20-0111 TaxID=3127648 RepID=UPI003104E5CF